MILVNGPMDQIRSTSYVSCVVGQFDDSPDDVQAQLGSNSWGSGQFDDSPDDRSDSFLIDHADGNHMEMSSTYQQKNLGTTRTSQNFHQKCAATTFVTGIFNTTISESSPLHKEIGDPTDIDILCGRGGKTNNHIGNREFRFLVDSCQEEYGLAPKRRKTELSRAIVTAIRARGGRFLKLEKNANIWYDVGDTKAVEKTSQALRGARKRKSINAKRHDDDSSESCNSVVSSSSSSPLTLPLHDEKGPVRDVPLTVDVLGV